ncbi:MAG TPA: carboxypeptidase-like regulatory domain-containing protein [Longimicrobium sp.]|nr:carboxypeptidase-like regulatory domain-containing protein [Longimicrobium sp.]
MKLCKPLFSAAAVLVCLSAPDAAAAQVIVGRVIDAASGGGVAQARVTVVGGARGETRRTRSAANGRFTIGLRRGGSYRVHVARTGYVDTRTRPLTVLAGDTVEVNVRVSTAALGLDPLTVTTRPRRLDVVGVFRDTADAGAAVNGPEGASGGRRNLVVRGTMPTPTACYELAGAADRIGPIITMNVEAHATGQACAEVPGAFKYKVTARGLPPATYAFRVLHTYRGGVWNPRVALDTTVVVR